MKTKIFAGLVLWAACTPALAGLCTSTTSWGGLGPPDVEVFGASFSTSGTFTDCYSFTLSSSANSFGGVIEINTLFNKLDIDVTSVSLTGGSLVDELVSLTPVSFSFAGLFAGTYELAVIGVVSNDPGLWRIPVGYAGLISTIAANISPPTTVYEPAALSLLGAGLLGLGLARRGRRQRS